MFEAYKVGITIALTNKVSQGLMLIGRDLAKTDAQALKLKSTLNEIKLLGVGGAILGGAGYAGLSALDKTYKVAKEYQQALSQFKSLNLGDAINTQADKFARGSSVIGASATDLIRTTRDLTTVLGDFGLAKQLAPGFAQIKYANQAVYGGHGIDFNETQLRDLERIIEMKGGFKSASDFLAQASMMQQAIAGTGGMVKPSDYLNFIKTSGVAGRQLTNGSFYYGMEPLIQEMGGSRVGTGLMSAYNNLAQGRTTVRAATELMRLGLLDPKMVEYTKIGTIKQVRPGALKGMDEFTADPFEWMKHVLLPAMAGKGITSENDVLNSMGAIFSNRTASSLFSLMYLQQHKIEKNMELSRGAMGTDALVKLARSSPEGAEVALAKSWENLKIAAGESLVPVIIPALNQLADSMRALGQWINRHPVKFDYLVKGFAALSGALLFGGTVLTLTAGFKALGLVIGVAGGASGVISSVVGLTAALGPLAAVALTIAGIVNHQGIADKIDSSGWGQKLGDTLYRIFTPQGREDLMREHRQLSVAPTGSGKATTVQTTINLDGRTIARAVSEHQYGAMNRAPSTGAAFDGKMSFIPPSYTPFTP